MSPVLRACYSRLALRAGVRSFEDAAKKGSRRRLVIGDESIPDDVVPPRPKAPWFTPLPQMQQGDPLPNINILQETPDPILMADESYPPWIWSCLETPSAKQYLEDWEITSRKQLRAMNHFRIQMANSQKTKLKKGPNPFK